MGEATDGQPVCTLPHGAEPTSHQAHEGCRQAACNGAEGGETKTRLNLSKFRTQLPNTY